MINLSELLFNVHKEIIAIVLVNTISLRIIVNTNLVDYIKNK